MGRLSATDRVTFWALTAGAVAAGALHMIVQMGYEATAGTGAWTPLQAIAAVVLRDLQGDPTQGGPGAVLLGLVLHFLVSIGLGVPFALAATRLSDGPGPLLSLGLLWGAIVFAGAWFVAIPLTNPAMGILHPGVLLVSHLAWGLVVGASAFRVAEAQGPMTPTPVR